SMGDHAYIAQLTLAKSPMALNYLGLATASAIGAFVEVNGGTTSVSGSMTSVPAHGHALRFGAREFEATLHRVDPASAPYLTMLYVYAQPVPLASYTGYGSTVDLFLTSLPPGFSDISDTFTFGDGGPFQDWTQIASARA